MQYIGIGAAMEIVAMIETVIRNPIDCGHLMFSSVVDFESSMDMHTS